MKKHVVIIGGGASGLTAAICAARQSASVTIIEHMDRVGKKILSTGNGKCNLTNLYLDDNCYRSEQKDFPYQALKKYGVEDTLEFFRKLGIYPKDKNGYIYPNSEQASSVLDVLRMEVGHLGVRVRYNCKTERIEKPNTKMNKFTIYTSEGTIEADVLILAAGSKAASNTGSDGSGYELAKQLGHHIIKPLPALVQLRCKGDFYKQLAGIRTEAELRLYVDDTFAIQERGELQLTDYGISGIPVFQISRYASRALDLKKKVTVGINYLPGMDKQQAGNLLLDRFTSMSYKTAEECMTGLLNKKLCYVLLKLSDIPADRKACNVNKEQLMLLARQITGMEAVVTAANPFANAQVCCGGIDTREIDASTMGSRLVPGLYLAGEIIDVDGICGGYNLQWAWSSGSLAGYHAGRG